MRTSFFFKVCLGACFGSSLVLGGIACGGGGGASLTNIRMVSTIGGNPADTGSLIAGDVVALSLVGTDANGLTVPVGGNFATNAPASVATVTGGTLNATGDSLGTVYTLTGRGGGSVLNADVRVFGANQAILTGKVRATTGTGLSGVRVLFFNAAGTQVATGTTGSTGIFRAGIPLTATRFSIDLSTADPGTGGGGTIFYRQFAFGTRMYLANDSGCRAALQTLTAGNNVLVNDIVPPARADGPAPPPSGCLG